MPALIGLILLLLPTNSVANPVNPWGEWQEAKELYDAGKIDEALRSLKEHPGDSAEYFHNLGTILLRMKRPGQAVAYLTKADNLRPHDPAIQQNLQAAQAELIRTIGEAKVDPASSSLEALADRVPLHEIRGTVGVMALLVLFLWFRAYLKSRQIRAALSQPSGWVAVIGLALTLSIYAAERIASEHPPAFALESEAIRSGPGETFLQVGQIEPGIKVRLLGPTENEWRQIRYSSEDIGWVRSSSLLLL